MTVTEFIEKLHKWAAIIGPEDKVEITPVRLLGIFDPIFPLLLFDIYHFGKITDQVNKKFYETYKTELKGLIKLPDDNN